MAVGQGCARHAPVLDRSPRRAEEESGQRLRSLFLDDQAVCVPSTATVDSHQAICTPEEAVGSCWAVGEQSLSGSPGRTLGEPGFHEPEELGFRLQHCRALIQTRLSGTPAGGQGSLITYSLFLKTPVHGNGQYITTPRKKIFSPRNLKLTLFNSDIC
ncbi:hypothetical protein JEQ12_008110 [Ovis aries]|uniref:Aftiphilin clathrin-binding box domain-containing protein n=1 Tax=Ovis aries TaxID=9940 RepID=A0A835ZPL9_SHEEP|nr:hypothetical protein JEQ12_008110 [Ovis aries]